MNGRYIDRLRYIERLYDKIEIKNIWYPVKFRIK